MQIQLEPVDYRLLKQAQDGKLEVPFKSFWHAKVDGRLLVLADGVARLQLVDGMADEVFRALQRAL